MSGLVFGMFHLNINQFAYALVSGVILHIWLKLQALYGHQLSHILW